MTRNMIQNEIEEILSLSNDDQPLMINRLDKLIQKVGIEQITAWRNPTNKSGNTLMHEFVEKNCPDVIQHLAVKYQFDIDIHRESDDKTPSDLAQSKDDEEMVNLLQELNYNKMIEQSPDDAASQVDNRKKMNIVWLDLEMTSIEDPKIMECAVIITDKYLNELERDEWVIHYNQKELDTLGSWHQEQFKSVDEGGNGLFEACIKSNLSEAEVEQKLLQILQRHCPEKQCPLAGSSIHIDKEVLKQRMPKAHDYLHYRIIDVSSFRGMLKRWAPRNELKFVSKLSKIGRDTVNHRAMDDIEYSMELMKLFHPLLTGRPYQSRKPQDRSLHKNEKNDAAEASALPKGNRSVGNFESDRSTYYADEKALIARLELEKKTNVKALKLDKKLLEMYDRNPHLREIVIDGRSKIDIQKGFGKENRFLDLHIPISSRRMPVQHHSTTEHWGTRKLLLTDIEFLTNYARTGKYLVIYIGAAPGIHINYLSDLFPDLDFVLIDTKKVETKKTPKIHIRSGEFIEDIVKEYSKSRKDLLLICDVHTLGTQDDLDDNLVIDMLNQEEWHSSMKPIASLLTFHFPRTQNRIQNFKGDLILEPWASRRSNGCRLVVQKTARLIDYDIKSLKLSMDYFQNVLRTTYYEHDLRDSNTDGLDHCYDCRSEIFILSRYLEKIQKIPSEQLLKAVPKVSEEISKSISDRNRPSIVNGIRTLAVIPKK
ncbi:unnamed protein product [Rotaria sordida]|uniref:Cap-specific mRNA (nucleoside-2'-O-)-methyltransferase n=1 Tax=Rotaria sordida TaxID=392033 RepID=A0A814RUQ8_9BILA|nr:unnamed protein product [Rotaria sordida]